VSGWDLELLVVVSGKR